MVTHIGCNTETKENSPNDSIDDPWFAHINILVPAVSVAVVEPGLPCFKSSRRRCRLQRWCHVDFSQGYPGSRSLWGLLAKVRGSWTIRLSIQSRKVSPGTIPMSQLKIANYDAPKIRKLKKCDKEKRALRSATGRARPGSSDP